jgi:hypothetical protein
MLLHLLVLPDQALLALCQVSVLPLDVSELPPLPPSLPLIRAAPQRRPFWFARPSARASIRCVSLAALTTARTTSRATRLSHDGGVGGLANPAVVRFKFSAVEEARHLRDAKPLLWDEASREAILRPI